MASEGVDAAPALMWHRDGTTSQAEIARGGTFRIFPANGAFELQYASIDGKFYPINLYRNRPLAKRGAMEHYNIILRNRGAVEL